MFAVSSTYAAGTAGRQLATLEPVSVTLLGFLLATQQAEIAPLSSAKVDGSEGESEPSDRIRLLSSEADGR